MTETEFREGDDVWYTGEGSGGMTVSAKIAEIGHNTTIDTEPDEHGQHAVNSVPVYLLIPTDNPTAPGITVTDVSELASKDD